MFVQELCRLHEIAIKYRAKNPCQFPFKGRTTDQWNNLPADVVEVDSLNIFMNRLDNLWKTKGIIFDPEIDIMAVTASSSTRYARI